MIRMSAPANTASKAAGEFAVPVADQEPEPFGVVAEVHDQGAGLLGDPGPGGVSGDPGDVHAAAAVLDHHQDVEPAQEDGVDVGEVERDGGEDRVEGSGELGVAVPDEEPEAPSGVVEIHAEVAGLLGQPGTGGMGGDAEDVHAAGGVLDHEEDVQPAQADGVQMEQVAGQDRVRLRAQEFSP
jgi:hypothetical protein